MEKEEKNNITDIEPLLKASNDMKDNIDKLVYNSTTDTRKMLASDENDVNRLLNKLIKNTKDVSNGDMIGSLENIFKSSSKKEYEEFNKLKSTLENSDNLNVISAVFDTSSNLVNKYEDMQIVANIVPQINDAIDTMTDSIISPDDYLKQVSSVIKIDGREIDSDTDFFKKVKEIKRQYKLDNLTKKIVKKTLTFGKSYASVVSYADAFKKFADQKNKIRRLNESTDIRYNNDYKILSENLTEEKDNINIKNVYEQFAKNISICEGSEFLTEAVSKEVVSGDKETMEIFKKVQNKSKKSNNNTSVGSNDGLLTNDSDTKYDIEGCVVKLLDIRNIIPIKIDDKTLGYFYIQNSETFNVVKNFRKQQSMYMKSKLSQQKVNDNLDMIYRSLSDLVIKKLDKKFIEKNQEIKEHMYTLLKYNDALNSNVDIIYLKPTEVVEFEINDGVSTIEPVLFFAKLYLGLMLTNIMMKISRSNDIRAYYLKTGIAPDVAAMVNLAISDLKKDQKNLTHINHIPKLIASLTKFTDLIIPTDNQGGKPIEFDVVAGQDVNIKDDLMDMLEDIILNGMGTPTPLLSATNEVDYARRLSMLNSKYLRRIISHQLDLNFGFTNLYRYILTTHVTKDDTYAEQIDSVTHEFSTPLSLSLQTLLDQISSARDLSNALTGMLLGENSDNPKLNDAVNRKIIRKYTPFVEWDDLDGIVEQCRIELKEEETMKSDDENM